MSQIIEVMDVDVPVRTAYVRLRPAAADMCLQGPEGTSLAAPIQPGPTFQQSMTLARGDVSTHN
jgi:hypothetical protein